ncbi:MAG: hypothetical protein G01um101491_384, partial [Parcubacteria group bacterium Gr01-1014_91]
MCVDITQAPTLANENSLAREGEKARERLRTGGLASHGLQTRSG